MEPKNYHLFIPRLVKVMIFGVLAVLTVAGLTFLLLPTIHGNGDFPGRIFSIFWFGMLGWWWYWVSSIPYRIQVHEAAEIEFISVLRRRRVKPTEIRSITPESQLGFLTVRHSGGKIRLLNQFDGFHEFITILKQNNPTVELRGC